MTALLEKRIVLVRFFGLASFAKTIPAMQQEMITPITLCHIVKDYVGRYEEGT